MGAVLLIALTASLVVYGVVIMLPRFSPRRDLVRRLGMRRGVRTAQVWLMQAGLAGGAAAIVLTPWVLFGLSPDWVALAVYPLVGWTGPLAWIWLGRRRRQALMARTYPDLLSHLAAQTQAGASTLQAFASVPPVLREPLRSEVEDLIADLRVAPFPAALERFAQRCGVPEVRDFAHHVTYQQSLGIALAEVLEAEEAHTLAMARQTVRRRIQASAVVMAAVTVILLVNGLMIYLTPVAFAFTRLVAGR